MQDMAKEIRFMAKHSINTIEQLTSHKDSAATRMAELSNNRKRLRNKTGNLSADTALTAIKAEIAEISAQISELRREVKLCESIANRSVDMKDKIHRANEAEAIEKAAVLNKSTIKDVKKNEPFRRRR